MAKKDKSAPEQNPAEQKEQAAGQPVVPEADAGASDSVTLSAKEFDEVKAHIASLQKEKDEMLALAQRTQADFDNFRRRNAGVRADSLDEGKREAIAQLLPVLDNFERAMEVDAENSDAWRDGIKLVYKQMCDSLKKLGLSEVPTDGAFDPNIHNAVMREKAEGKESGAILLVLQKGYCVGDRILRHAMVKVAE